MEIKDIEKLARLARIELTEEEKNKFLKEIDSILGYVDQIKSAIAQTGGERKIPAHRNIMRLDLTSNESCSDSALIINEFPDRVADSLKVKKIL